MFICREIGVENTVYSTYPLRLELREKEIWKELIELTARQERGEISENDFLSNEVSLVRELSDLQELRRRLQ
jgi:hypothetical protein